MPTSGTDERARRPEEHDATARREIQIPPLGLAGTLSRPAEAQALILFAHGSGSSRFSPRNMQVAAALNRRRMATLLLDLLLAEEEADRRNVFNIGLLASRLMAAVKWAGEEPEIKALPVGLFGSSTGAAAALAAAAELGSAVGAVVSRGGRPDLAGSALPRVRAPTLLIVGGADFGVIELNQEAFWRLGCPKSLEIVRGATHLFPEPGALEQVVDLAGNWFERHLVAERAGGP
ncbi:MAG TPA: dienelactone hydrolase family protein [Paracoccaceae bacterium]|nr:dienelactone hydrolase family protein [Paracoccaceae bacterium]